MGERNAVRALVQCAPAPAVFGAVILDAGQAGNGFATQPGLQALRELLDVLALFRRRVTEQAVLAGAECQQAVDLNPNSASAHSWYGMVLLSMGRYEESILELEQAVRLDPFSSTWILRSLGSAYTWAGRYKEAISALERAVQNAPNDQFSHISLVLAYSFAGQQEEAQAEAAEVLRINPKFSPESYVKEWENQAEKDRAIDAFRWAGLK